MYLRTQELLALQTPADELVVPDELLFQIQHQTQELWLKCVAFETGDAGRGARSATASFAALAALDRIVLIARSRRTDARAVHALAVALPCDPAQPWQRQRARVARIQQMLAAAEAARRALERSLQTPRRDAARGLRDPGQLPGSASPSASDSSTGIRPFQSWLVEHFMLVRRTLGIDKTVRALDGFPTVALGARMTRPLFPELWNVRVEMSRAWTREGGYRAWARSRGRRHASRWPRQAPYDHARGRRATSAISRLARVPARSAVRVSEQQLRPARLRGRRKLVLDEYWRTLEDWRDEVWQHWWPRSRATPTRSPALIGAPAGSVVCDTNVATLLGRVLSCFDFRERPRVVTTDLEFPSIAVRPAGFAAVRRGARRRAKPRRNRDRCRADRRRRSTSARNSCACPTRRSRPARCSTWRRSCGARARSARSWRSTRISRLARCRSTSTRSTSISFSAARTSGCAAPTRARSSTSGRRCCAISSQPRRDGSRRPIRCRSRRRPAGPSDARRFASGTPAVLPVAVLAARPRHRARASASRRSGRSRCARTDRIIALRRRGGLGRRDAARRTIGGAASWRCGSPATRRSRAAGRARLRVQLSRRHPHRAAFLQHGRGDRSASWTSSCGCARAAS